MHGTSAHCSPTDVSVATVPDEAARQAGLRLDVREVAVADRDELIDAALGQHTVVLERTIDVHIRALRQKLGNHSPLIETVRGIGYRLRDPASA